MWPVATVLDGAVLEYEVQTTRKFRTPLKSKGASCISQSQLKRDSFLRCPNKAGFPSAPKWTKLPPKAPDSPLSMICSPDKAAEGWSKPDGAQPSPQNHAGLPLHLAAPHPQPGTPGGSRGWGIMQSGAAAADICSPSISAPSSLFCQQQLLAPDGQQSQRGPADLFSSSLSSPSPAEEG